MFRFILRLHAFCLLVALASAAVSVQNSAAQSPAVNLLLSTQDKIILVKKFDATPELSLPLPMVVFDDQIWFTGSDSEHGTELWRSDGTHDGTVLAADIDPGPQSSVPLFLTVYNNSLIYIARDGTNGFELRKTFWDSGLSEYRTVLLKDIYPGSDNGIGINLASGKLVNFRGKLVFTGKDPVYGEEVWMTDGTTAGTVRVTDINPGLSDAEPSNFTVLDTRINNPSSLEGDILLFSAKTSSSGEELWRIKRSLIFPYSFISAQVKDINPAVNTGGKPEPLGTGGSFSLYDGNLYFSADDGTNGRELWRTDGYSSGTSMVKNIHSSGSSLDSGGYGAAVFEGDLYFSATSGTITELWKTDGTNLGTTQAFSAGPATSGTTFISFVHNSGLFFSTVMEVTGSELTGTLWKRYWDESSLSWQSKNISSVISFPNFFSLLVLNHEFNNQMYFTGLPDYTSSGFDKYGIYRVKNDDTLKKVERGVHLTRAAAGYLEYKGSLYFISADGDDNLMLLKLLGSAIP